MGADHDNARLLCSAFRNAIAGALTGPLAEVHGSRDAAISALLAVTVELSKAAGVDFAHMACAMIATVEPDSAKAVGALISCYARRGKGGA